MSSSKPLVSVIVPVYNGEKHIAATLNSIIDQDYENLEIIVVNDVSSDSSAEIVKKILNKSSRSFSFIERSENGGQCASRNTGLKVANGDYVIFFDHDDLAEQNFVSSLCREAEDKNADLVFCGIKHFIESENKFENEPVTLKEKLINSEDYLIAWAKREMHFWSVWNFIFRKSFIEKFNLHYNEQCRLGEDTEFVLKSLAAAGRVSFVNEMLYIYVHHDDRTSVKYKDNREIFESLLLSRYRSIRPVIRRMKNNKTVINYALSFYMADSYVDQLTKCARHDDFTKMKRILAHKKIREILFSSIKFLFLKPEVFMKSLILLLMPRLYYKMRKN